MVCHFHYSHCQWSQYTLRVVLSWRRYVLVIVKVFIFAFWTMAEDLFSTMKALYKSGLPLSVCSVLKALCVHMFLLASFPGLLHLQLLITCTYHVTQIYPKKWVGVFSRLHHILRRGCEAISSRVLVSISIELLGGQVVTKVLDCRPRGPTLWPHWQQGFFLFRVHSTLRKVTFVSFGGDIKPSALRKRV